MPLLGEDGIEETINELKEKFLTLKKYNNTLSKDYEKIMGQNYEQKNWANERTKVTSNINKYKQLFNQVNNTVEKLKNTNISNSQTKRKIDDELKKIDKFLQQDGRQNERKIEDINDKTKDWEDSNLYSYDSNNNENGLPMNQFGSGLKIEEINDSEERLKARKDELNIMYQVSSALKDMTDTMATKVNEQGEMLQVVEDHVDKAVDNTKKGQDEINTADKMSKKNRSRLIFLIVLIVVVVGIIILILYFTVFKKDKESGQSSTETSHEKSTETSQEKSTETSQEKSTETSQEKSTETSQEKLNEIFQGELIEIPLKALQESHIKIKMEEFIK